LRNILNFVEYISEHPAAVLSDIRHNLCEVFPGLTISTSALHRPLVQKCKVTPEKFEKLIAARNSDRVLTLLKEKPRALYRTIQQRIVSCYLCTAKTGATNCYEENCSSAAATTIDSFRSKIFTFIKRATPKRIYI